MDTHALTLLTSFSNMHIWPCFLTVNRISVDTFAEEEEEVNSMCLVLEPNVACRAELGSRILSLLNKLPRAVCPPLTVSEWVLGPNTTRFSPRPLPVIYLYSFVS